MNTILPILIPELNTFQLQSAMNNFSSLFTEKQELYLSISKKSIQMAMMMSNSSQTSSVKRSNSVSNQSQKDKNHLSNTAELSINFFGQNSSQEIAQESRASKRAKLMQNSAIFQQQNQSTITPRTKGLALLSTVESLQRSGTTQISDDSKLKSKSCNICQQSPPVVALVSSCGHICCQGCWNQWLRVKSICPVCRISLTSSDLAKLRVAS